MKILLTGATGGLGFWTLECLLENPKIEKIIATGRVIRPTNFIKNKKIWTKIIQNSTNETRFYVRFFLVKRQPEIPHQQLERDNLLEKQLSDQDPTAIYTF